MMVGVADPSRSKLPAGLDTLDVPVSTRVVRRPDQRRRFGCYWSRVRDNFDAEMKATLREI